MQFDLVKRFGVTVVEVEEPLPRAVLYVREHNVAFVSGGLDDAGRQAAADWLLSAALCPPATRR